MKAEEIAILDDLIERSEAGETLTRDEQLSLYCFAKRFRKTAKVCLLLLEGKRRADNQTIRDLILGESYDSSTG